MVALSQENLRREGYIRMYQNPMEMLRGHQVTLELFSHFRYELRQILVHRKVRENKSAS